MNEPFELPVTFKGEELLFPAQLKQLGYLHRFVVEVYGQELYFEPDEEQNYRALVDAALVAENKKIDSGLLKAIAEGIASIVR